MTPPTLSTTIDYDGGGMDVTVSYTYTRGRPGQRVDGARFAEPDDPSEVEVLAVRDDKGFDHLPNLDRKAFERVETLCFEQGEES